MALEMNFKALRIHAHMSFEPARVLDPPDIFWTAVTLHLPPNQSQAIKSSQPEGCSLYPALKSGPVTRFWYLGFVLSYIRTINLKELTIQTHFPYFPYA